MAELTTIDNYQKMIYTIIVKEVRKMKTTAKILLLVIVLTMCFSLFGCGDIGKSWSKGNTAFQVTIDGVSGSDTLDFEIATETKITVKLYGEDITDETYKDIKIDCNHENTVVSYAYSRKSQKEIVFLIYLYELGDGNELSFVYKGKTVKVNYNVVDYNFEGHGYVVPNSLDDLNKYPEFKEMLLSIKRYEFKEPYVGMDESNFTTLDNDYVGKIKYWSYDAAEDESNPGYIATDYLQYLKDSVYYPSKFDTVKENPVSSIDVSMSLPMSAKISAGAGRDTMNSFGINYSVIDPDCTNPESPLRSMTFYASDKANGRLYLDKETGKTYPSLVSIFLEKYPERFFVYKLGDINVYILMEEDGVSAYFEDETYYYSVSAVYSDD